MKINIGRQLMSGKYGAYKLTLSAFNNTPIIKLLYSSDNSDECITQAHLLAESFYRKQSNYSLFVGILPLKTKWVVYNLMSYELEIFYACRKADN